MFYDEYHWQYEEDLSKLSLKPRLIFRLRFNSLFRKCKLQIINKQYSFQLSMVVDLHWSSVKNFICGFSGLSSSFPSSLRSKSSMKRIFFFFELTWFEAFLTFWAHSQSLLRPSHSFFIPFNDVKTKWTHHASN